MFRQNLLVFCAAAALAACSGGGGSSAPSPPPPVGNPSPPPAPQPQPAGNRFLGLATIPADGESFDDAFALVRDAGVMYLEAPVIWDEYETSPGVYIDSNEIADLNTFLGATDWTVTVTLSGVDTNNDRRPDAYKNLAWDDPVLIDAYWTALLDLVSKFPDANITDISVGNEINIFLQNGPQQTEYLNLIDEIERRANTAYPDVNIGAKVTVGGWLGDQTDFIDRVASESDIVMATYYAIAGDFQAKSASDARADIEAFAAGFPGKAIQFSEIGTHSSSSCGSSNALQADFVREMFTVWDENSDQITHMNFLWQTDIPDDHVDTLVQYYGVSNICFREYLAELGFRERDGTDKGAMAAFTEEAQARGFGQ